MSIPAQSDRPFRFIFHIGAGKTGTSSVQETLRLNREGVKVAGTAYFGLMLEFAPEQRYSWQKAAGSKEFLALEGAEATEQVIDVLRRSIDRVRAEGCRQAIWSNEWFFGRHAQVMPAMEALAADGIEVWVVAYVRRHDAWARSAYVQWGIKHKTYKGPLMPFERYRRIRPARFGTALQPWSEGSQWKFILRNMDSVGDVVSDFLTLCGVSNESLETVRTNESPGSEELLLRALFNSRAKGEVLPNAFDSLFGVRNIDFESRPDEWLRGLMPTKAALEAVLNDSEADREAIRPLLTAAGQDPLADLPLMNHKEFDVDQLKLVGILFHMLAHQAQKLHRLDLAYRELLLKLEAEQISPGPSPDA
jgi:hypothetical protein